MSTISSLGGSNSSLNSSGIQFSGLATGIDTQKIIEGLVAIQQAKIDNLQKKKDQYLQQQTAFKSIDAKVLDLQSQAGRLSRTFNSPFDARAVSSSDTSLATAAASSNAVAGVYRFKINNLAQAHQIASQGFSSANSTLTQGTLQIRVGTAATTTITIDGSNNTLAGLANAINNSASDVSAGIVNTGSGNNPFQLVLTAKSTGAANTISITNNLAASSGDSIQPQLTTTVQAATDANITVGTGNGALTINSSTKQVEDIFAGVTLNLLSADNSKTVTLTVVNDTAVSKKAVQDLVNSFNDVIDLIQNQTSYDAQTNKAGILLGNHNVNDIADSLTATLSGVVNGVSGLANRLSAVGVALNDQGKLEIDDAKLSQALNGQLTGVTIRDLRRLFALDGVSDNAGVQFISASDKTQNSSSGYQVVVTLAAKQASLTATNSLAGSIVLDNSNNTLLLSLDGRDSGTVTLAQGTYTPQTLAQELQAEINARSQLANSGINVSVENNHLKLTSQAFGSVSNVSIKGGTSLLALGLNGAESAQGQDVAGHFLVDGNVESAQANGQFLKGLASNSHTADLQVRVTLSESQIPASANADVTLTRGLAAQLVTRLNTFLDPVIGRLQSQDTTYQETIAAVQQSIDRQKTSLDNRQQALVKQFAAMEAAVASLKSTGDLLTAQLTNVLTTKK